MDERKYQVLRRILADKALVPEAEIRPDSDIFDELDIDSLCLVEAFVEIQDAFRVKLHPAELPRESFNTPEKILLLIAQSCP